MTISNPSINVESRLGALVAEYGATKVRSQGNLWSGVVFIILGVIGVIAGAAAAVTETGASVVGFCGGVGLLSIAGGAWAIRTHRQEKDMTVQVYRDGIVSTKNGRVTTMQWANVKELNPIVIYNRQLRTPFYTYTLKDVFGHTMRINLTPGNLENGDQLAQLIQHAVTKQQVAQAMRRLDAGERLSFGPLTMTQEGLKNGRHTLSWSDYAKAEVSPRGYFLVYAGGQKKSWARIDMSKMTNTFTFLALANQMSAQL